MNDNRKVANPLLSASVTGGIEDYFQNAVLLPAAEPPPPPQVPQQMPETFLGQPALQGFVEAKSDDHKCVPADNSGINFFGPPEESIPEQNPLQSVLTSFSSYLNIGQKSSEPFVPAPTVVEALPVQPTDVPLVPLFSPTDYETPVTFASKPPTGTTVNNYRRGTNKRPAYVPIPGLSNPQPQSFQPLPTQSPLNQFPVSTYQPELTGFGNPPIQTIPGNKVPIPSLRTCEPQLASSAFLRPISPAEFTLNFKPSVGAIPNLSPATMASEPARMSPIRTPSYNVPSPDSESSLPLDGQQYMYRPVYHHWFHKKDVDGKEIWTPFTMMDSLLLENTFLSNDLSPDQIVATDGGRCDVNILRRERVSVYWESKPNEVRRCSWFRKGTTDGRYVPYEENVAARLEEEFKIAYESNTWNRKVELTSGETIVFHGPDVLVLFPQAQSPDAWGNTPNQPRPRVVKRGMDEFHIDEGEPNKVDHLLFLVHGIGSVCDLKFRQVEEVVDEFRSTSLQLVQSHYKSSCEKGTANRVEVLPISWHGKLHNGDTGVDQKLQGITLESIPKLRDFTNDTILDVLFYTSPVYCQTIVSFVANELNRVYEIFKKRNPNFIGGVSLGGHSLGSLILFDILCHQKPEKEESENGESELDDVVSPLKPDPKDRKISRRISYMMSTIGTGQPQLTYPQLSFSPKHFFALGSPIGMFVTVRGLDNLGEQFSLPTCPAFFNIFHPYDPVAYRMEALINPELATLKPVLIPHHKGRKRMHLELKETMARVGADLKQRIVDSMKTTWNSFYQWKIFKQNEPRSLEEEVDKVLEEQMKEAQINDQVGENIEPEHTDLSLGILNNGRRIDYVLQEAPLEFFNEYIFALSSHVCYWESEDTMLLILKEIYNSLNLSTDNQIPQQTMTIERPTPMQGASGYERVVQQANQHFGVDPTVPMLSRSDIGPPPMQGFVKKN